MTRRDIWVWSNKLYFMLNPLKPMHNFPITSHSFASFNNKIKQYAVTAEWTCCSIIIHFIIQNLTSQNGIWHQTELWLHHNQLFHTRKKNEFVKYIITATIFTGKKKHSAQANRRMLELHVTWPRLYRRTIRFHG